MNRRNKCNEYVLYLMDDVKKGLFFFKHKFINIPIFFKSRNMSCNRNCFRNFANSRDYACYSWKTSELKTWFPYCINSLNALENVDVNVRLSEKLCLILPIIYLFNKEWPINNVNGICSFPSQSIYHFYVNCAAAVFVHRKICFIYKRQCIVLHMLLWCICILIHSV